MRAPDQQICVQSITVWPWCEGVSFCLSVDLHKHFTPAQYIPVYRHLSQMHQRIRVGSRLPQNRDAFDMVAERG